MPAGIPQSMLYNSGYGQQPNVFRDRSGEQSIVGNQTINPTTLPQFSYGFDPTQSSQLGRYVPPTLSNPFSGANQWSNQGGYSYNLPNAYGGYSPSNPSDWRQLLSSIYGSQLAQPSQSGQLPNDYQSNPNSNVYQSPMPTVNTGQQQSPYLPIMNNRAPGTSSVTVGTPYNPLNMTFNSPGGDNAVIGIGSGHVVPPQILAMRRGRNPGRS